MEYLQQRNNFYQVIQKIAVSPKLMHLHNLAINLLFILQAILSVVYTIGPHMEKNERLAGKLLFSKLITDDSKTLPSRKRSVLHFFGVEIFFKCGVS